MADDKAVMVTSGTGPRRGEARPQLRKANRNHYTQAQIDTFLAALAMTCNVRRSAEAAKMSEQGVYQLRKRRPGFRDAWFAALSEGYARLELLMLARAIAQFDGAGAGSDPVSVPVSERGALALLAAHRQSVRETRAAQAVPALPKAQASDPDDVRARLEARLAEMRQRLMASGDDA